MYLRLFCKHQVFQIEKQRPAVPPQVLDDIIGVELGLIFRGRPLGEDADALL